MDLRKTITNHLLNNDARVMQLATVQDTQPWICTVWFVADKKLNLYWLSLPSRRHSQELTANQKIAAAVVVKSDMPTIGLQVEGTAQEVTEPKRVQEVMKNYVAKYGEGKFFYDRLLAGTNQHALYCLRPKVVALYDGVNFPEAEKQELHLSSKD